MIDVKKLKDQDLFNISLDIENEIKRRILNSLKSFNLTCYYFKPIPEVIVRTTVFNAYNNFEESVKDINVIAIGYTTERENGKLKEYLYVLDDTSHFYSNEELENLWDVYSQLIEEL